MKRRETGGSWGGEPNLPDSLKRRDRDLGGRQKGDGKMKHSWTAMTIRTLVAVTVICMLPSCTQVIIDGAGYDKVASLTPVAGSRDFSIVKHFGSTRKVWYLLWGILPLGGPDVGSVIAREAAGSDGVANVKVTDKYGFVDFLVDVVLGVVTLNTRTVRIEGDAIRYQKSSP